MGDFGIEIKQLVNQVWHQIKGLWGQLFQTTNCNYAVVNKVLLQGSNGRQHECTTPISNQAQRVSTTFFKGKAFVKLDYSGRESKRQVFACGLTAETASYHQTLSATLLTKHFLLVSLEMVIVMGMSLRVKILLVCKQCSYLPCVQHQNLSLFLWNSWNEKQQLPCIVLSPTIENNCSMYCPKAHAINSVHLLD